MRKLLLISIILLTAASAVASDLWFFQLTGPVKSIEMESIETIRADFDREGRITYMRYGEHPVTVYRDATGRIDSITYIADIKTNTIKRVDDYSTTKYRQRATDERGNWIARKTQRLPYIITTEYCSTIYYE